MVAADFVGWEPNGWSVQASATAAALVAAAFLLWSEKRFSAVQEAVIGVVFVLAASAEILLLSSNPHGAEHLKDLLVGQILWVTPAQLWPVAFLDAAVLAVCWWADLGRRRWLFYSVFAINITASVQLVGVFLVFASLIVPALAAKVGGTARPLGFAWSVGAAGYVVGLVASAVGDLPTGASVVCALVAVAAATAAAARVAPGKRPAR